jgi:hypothetical protein
MIILYQITQLSEQKYKLAIHFAENNFGPFEHLVFVIVVFEYPSKTLFRVLFASLYLQICIFNQNISISCPTISSKWVNPEIRQKPSKHCNICIVWPCKGQKWIRKVKLHLHAWLFHSSSSVIRTRGRVNLRDCEIGTRKLAKTLENSQMCSKI